MKKSYFIMLIALMCMFSCRTENTSDILSDQTHKSKFDASFKEVLQATKSPDESSLMAKVQDFTEDYNPSDFIMDTAKIKKTLKNGEVTEYAIYLKKKNETEIGVFYNLVFTKKIDSWKKYLVKFTPAIIPESNNKVGYKCEFISKKAQASKCGSSFYMTEYFQCWAGHTDSNDGDCNGCWRLGSYGIANTCDEEAPDDFNGAGDNYGGGATPNVDGLIHVYADPSHWALYNSLSAKNKFKCYQALLLSSDTSYVNFSIDFFSSNPTVTIQQFQNWFVNSNGMPKIHFDSSLNSNNTEHYSSWQEFFNTQNNGFTANNSLFELGTNDNNAELGDPYPITNSRVKLRLMKFNDSGVSIKVRSYNLGTSAFNIHDIVMNQYGITSLWSFVYEDPNNKWDGPFPYISNGNVYAKININIIVKKGVTIQGLNVTIDTPIKITIIVNPNNGNIIGSTFSF